MSILLERSKAAERVATPGVGVDGPDVSPVGGSYVSGLTSANSEGTYVTTASGVRPLRRGSYVTTSTIVGRIGRYTDTDFPTR